MELESLKEGVEYQYYHVIPDEILCNPKISSNAVRLFTLISALCNKTGYCWATNAYFETKLTWSCSTVKRALQELKTIEVVIIKIKRDPVTKQVLNRTITTDFKIKKDGIISEPPSRSNLNYPMPKSDPENNKTIIKKYNNKPSATFSKFKKQKTILEMTFEEWEEDEISKDKEHWMDLSKLPPEGMELHTLIRKNKFRKLQEAAKRNNT